MDTCKVCNGPLVNGQAYTLKASSKNFDVTVEGIPVRVCPKGHEGIHYFDKNFGTAFTEKMIENGIMAKGRRTLTLGFKHLCVSCGERLGKEKVLHEFTFEYDTKGRRGQFLKVTLKAPALHCNGCNRYYMPNDRGFLDAYSLELHHLLESTLKKEFIW